MGRWLSYAALLATVLLFLSVITSTQSLSQEKKVIRAQLNGFISSASVETVQDAMNRAADRDIIAVLLTLDTFGGSLDATFRILEIIQSAPVPVIGYVHPAGRQALSAGTLILMATDYAAMAPFTTIGSSQPVQGVTPINDTKIINALVEKIVGLARLHGRNETQAKRFITQNDNLLPEEALTNGVIEAIAKDIPELLEKADKVRVKTLSGEKILETRNASVDELGFNLRISIIRFFSDPLISSTLLAVGFLTIILGLTTPGYGAEIAGGILLLLGLLGQGFNVNFVAVALMAVGAGLIILEIYSPGFGALGLAGIGVLGLGMALMVTQPTIPTLVAPVYVENFIVSITVVLVVAGLFFGFIIYKAAKAIRLKRVNKAVPAGEGRAVDNLSPSTLGYVVVEGEYWQARSTVQINAGERIRVLSHEGRIMLVEPIRSQDPPSSQLKEE